MEKWQIKNASGKYVSIGMDGKPKWFESPDLGYTYTKDEAESFKTILEKEYGTLSIVEFDKDWWKAKLSSGGKLENIITAARITMQPTSFTDPMPQVFVTINGVEKYLFEYYPDEISFTAEEFIGLTTEEARHLKFEKDKLYLQKHSYAGGGDFLESTDLYLKEGVHDKEYHLQIIQRGKKYVVVAQFGRRGAHLQETEKGSYDLASDAMGQFRKVKHEKLAKGYIEQAGSGNPEPKKPIPEPKKPTPKKADLPFKEGDWFIDLTSTSNSIKYKITQIDGGDVFYEDQIGVIQEKVSILTVMMWIQQGDWIFENKKKTEEKPKEEKLSRIDFLLKYGY